VQLDDVRAPRARVQPVDVLGQDRPAQPEPLELGERSVCSIRLCSTEAVKSIPVEAPDAARISPEGVERGDLERVDVPPHPAVGAKVRDARLGGDAGACQHDERLPFTDERGQGLGVGYEHGRMAACTRPIAAVSLLTDTVHSAADTRPS